MKKGFLGGINGSDFWVVGWLVMVGLGSPLKVGSMEWDDGLGSGAAKMRLLVVR